ncbi:MAG: hypothetical protein ACJAWV_000019 [Flammeovirgaceae bacterium]|jgi:hypothetical protein
MNKIIFFELNEVPLRIFDYYIKHRPNSWLAKNFSKLKKYETYSENEGHLSPWNTWPTLHRGVPSSKHFIADFNQNMTLVDKEFPTIWNILAKNKIKTGVFGSLHSYPLPENPENYSFYVPDIFAAHHASHPKNVEIFQKFNLKLSRQSTRNVDGSTPIVDGAKLLLNSTSLGFKFKTMASIGKQLAEEKVSSWKVVRRRTYQTVLSFDVFYKLLATKKPDFVTFFTNHVASSLHRYWAASFPAEYEKMNYDDQWLNTYSNEILFAMDWTDDMLKRLGDFVDKNPDYKLVFSSSMGQEAVECEPRETELYIENFDKFMNMVGVTDSNEFKIMPAMMPQFNFFVSENYRLKFIESLENMTVNGEPMSFRERENCFFSVDLGHRNLKEINIRIGNKEIALEDSGMDNLVIQDKSSSTAYHIPEGHLFSYHPTQSASNSPNSQLPTCDILPIMLNNFGVKKEAYMNQVEYAEL